ncbi:MAG: fimbria/pilus outer membrane usher protein [Pseudomonadota bacterium]|nr:fimbria/pilus outer membrane usher protein [Pseudomonadota bacterium]
MATYSGWLRASVLIACAATAPTNAASAASADAPSEAVLEVSLSADAPGDMMVVLRGHDDQMYLDEGDFARLRLHLPQTSPYIHEGHRYFKPTEIKGCTIAVNEAQQRAVITAPSWALETTHLSAAERRHPAVTPASPGAFFNYQLSTQQVQGKTTGGAYGELGVFAGAGVLTNTAVGRFQGGQREAVRLDTAYTRDFPNTLQTLSAGDAISDGGTWGNAVRYAGVRWARNFGLRPDLLTTPLLSTSGSATVPSTVDVFVNNQLVSSNQLPAGPFVIDRLPTVSGMGDVSVVVRDALGRDQVVTQSFYSSASLLARGLSQYSFNMGSIRKDYTLDSNHYGPMLGEVSYRRGITDTFTLEGHGEYLHGDAHAAGVNAALGIGHAGIINFTAAGGGNGHGSGWLSGVGVERRGSNTSFIANTQWASRDFAQVGQALDPAMRMRQRTLFQTGIGLGRYGSLSLAYVRQTYRESPTQQTVGLTHSVSFGRAGTLNLTLTRTRSAADTWHGSSSSSPGQDSTSAFLIYVFSFDGRRAATVSSVSGSGPGAPANEGIVSLTESPPAGPGGGYRLSASTAGNYDADWRQQFAGADLEVEAARNQSIEGRSAYMSGAMTWLDGQLNSTRTVNGSFAMVDVAGLADVPVYVENQLTTHTDAHGRALLYNLRPYEANRISIAPEDLPLDTSIAASSTIMAPPYRSGVIARFPVERVRAATFRLITEDGKPVPVGALVQLKDSLFPVVLDGMVYVTGYDHGVSADASWNGGRCTFQLPRPPSDEPLPDVGTIRCRLSVDASPELTENRR